jgi:hypothetical protein
MNGREASSRRESSAYLAMVRVGQSMNGRGLVWFAVERRLLTAEAVPGSCRVTSHSVGLLASHHVTDNKGKLNVLWGPGFFPSHRSQHMAGGLGDSNKDNICLQ